MTRSAPVPGDDPLVTVVTPSLNQGRFIRETIESVLAQTYPVLEYLVMDGGSTDETVSILREYGDRLRWVSEPDGGQAAAVNAGWRRGRGSIVAYLNADDTYRPRAVECAVAAFRAHPEADVVYGEGHHVDAAGHILARYPTEPFRPRRLRETCFICQPTAFVRRGAAEAIGYLDEALHFCMDYDFWIRLSRTSRFVHIEEYLAASRLHADTKTLGQRATAHEEILGLVRGHFGYVAPAWIYAHAHAVLGPRPGPALWDQARFMARLIATGGATLVRYNRGLSLAELGRWQGWLREGWRRRRERGA